MGERSAERDKKEEEKERRREVARAQREGRKVEAIGGAEAAEDDEDEDERFAAAGPFAFEVARKTLQLAAAVSWDAWHDENCVAMLSSTAPSHHAARERTLVSRTIFAARRSCTSIAACSGSSHVAWPKRQWARPDGESSNVAASS